MKTRVQVVIAGRVQGVWYRASTKQKAEELGVSGWVKNRSDGCVEAVFEGETPKVKEMVEWCQTGPPLAEVSSVKILEKQLDGPLNGFRILRK